MTSTVLLEPSCLSEDATLTLLRRPESPGVWWAIELRDTALLAVFTMSVNSFIVVTSEMLRHRGPSLSKLQTLACQL